MRHRDKVLKSLVVLWMMLSFLTPCWALGLRIDKPKVRLSISPGGYESGSIEVVNSGLKEISVKVYLEDWVYSAQDGGKEFMPRSSTPLSCGDWITFYPADFSLVAEASRAVRYTVSVPEGAQGGHFAVLFFETGGGEIERLNEEGSLVRIRVLNRLGSLFYVEPEGTVEKKAEIGNPEISQKLNDLIVTLLFSNVGNTNITASGTFNVIDAEGFVHARGEFDDVYTLPQDTATLRATSQSAHLPSGSYDLLVTLEFSQGGALVSESGFTVAADGSIVQPTAATSLD